MRKITAEKIRTAADLAKNRSLSGPDCKVVFTNGCFDILHPGHIRGLEAAGQLGDILIVGVNSDTSVKRIKGADRPIMTDDSRAILIAALACVDFVVIFDEDTPEALINTLKPDIHVKGADYSGQDIPERKVVESYGGRVEFVELESGWSSSDLIKRLRSESPDK